MSQSIPNSKANVGSLAISDTSAHTVAVVDVLQTTGVGIFLRTTGSLVGSWAVKVSEDGVTSPCDITTAFSPSIAAVASSPNQQYAQCAPLIVDSLHFVFTASSGSGTASVGVTQKFANS